MRKKSSLKLLLAYLCIPDVDQQRGTAPPGGRKCDQIGLKLKKIFDNLIQTREISTFEYKINKHQIHVIIQFKHIHSINVQYLILHYQIQLHIYWM